MVYIASWQDYQEAAEELYEKSPNNVRLFSPRWLSQELQDTDAVLR
jgi:signal recognition particle subunit SRP9